MNCVIHPEATTTAKDVYNVLCDSSGGYCYS